MKQPDELYPDFSHLSDTLEKIEKLVKTYDLDIDDASKEDEPVKEILSQGRRKLVVKHSLKKQKLSDLLNPDFGKKR